MEVQNTKQTAQASTQTDAAGRPHVSDSSSQTAADKLRQDADKTKSTESAAVKTPAAEKTKSAVDMTELASIFEKSPPPEKLTGWRGELQTAADEMQKLQQIKPGDGTSAKERHNLITSIDAHFKKALPGISTDTTTADADLMKSVSAASMAHAELQKAIQVGNHKINPDKATIDDIHNAILNAPDEATRKSLSRVAMAYENRELAKDNVDEKYWQAKAPMMVALDYASFLLKYKDGVSQVGPGQHFVATNLIDSAMTPDMAASPQGKNLKQLSAEATSSFQNLYIDSSKNPALILQHLALGNIKPADQTAQLQKANALAQNKFFDPTNIDKEIARAKHEGTADTPMRVDALQKMRNVRTTSEILLAQDEATKQNGNKLDALDRLLNLAKDPKELSNTPQGISAFNGLVSSAVFGSPEEAGKLIGGFAKSSTSTENHFKRAQELLKNGSSEQATNELKAAGAANDQALNLSQSIKDKLTPEVSKRLQESLDGLNQKEKEKQPLSPQERQLKQTLEIFTQAADFHAGAMMTKAQLDLSGNKNNLALEDLQNLKKESPEFIAKHGLQKDFDAMEKNAQAGADYDNAGWAGKAWIVAKGLPGHAWDFMKQHEKLVAMGVGVAVGAAITAATFGAGIGVGIGAAMAIGAIGGGVVGTAAGVGMEYASGRNNTLLGKIGDVAPSAFAGGAAGALFVGAAEVGGLAGQSKMAMPYVNSLFEVAGEGRTATFLANGLRAAQIMAPISAVNTYENVKSGQDLTVSSALKDFATQESFIGLTAGITGVAPGIAGDAAARIGGVVPRLGVPQFMQPAIDYIAPRISTLAQPTVDFLRPIGGKVAETTSYYARPITSGLQKAADFTSPVTTPVVNAGRFAFDSGIKPAVSVGTLDATAQFNHEIVSVSSQLAQLSLEKASRSATAQDIMKAWPMSLRFQPESVTLPPAPTPDASSVDPPDTLVRPELRP